MPELVTIIFEDNHLLAVNKPAGTLVQGDSTGDKPLSEWIKDYLKEKYNKPGNVFLGVVHRLDRPVSGITVFAKTSKALSRMNALFRSRETRKKYIAVVKTSPPQHNDVLIHWLIKNEKKNKASSFKKEVKGSLRSELEYKVIGKLGQQYVLEVTPLTGRPHQIRIQLATIGCPIVGDVKYGFETPLPDASIALHAREISFNHPVRNQLLTLEAPFPNSTFWNPFSEVFLS